MTSYPNGIDTDADLPRVIDNSTEVTASIINAIRDAVIAIETAIGENPQGSQVDLVSRLNQILNQDGTFNSAALSAAGLVSLPITNAQIGSTAAIEESKLDLNVPTAYLQTQINSNDVDIAELQKTLAAQVLKLANHVLGLYDRHPSSHIDHTTLLDGYLSGYGSTVESVLNYIWGALLEHKSAFDKFEHFASAIKYIPDSGNLVATADNVQDTLTQIDHAFIENIRQHNDSHHSDGVSGDGYIFLSGQAATNDPSARLSRIPQSPNMIKMGLVNGVNVKSQGFLASAFSATGSSVTITAGVGSGNTRSLTVTNLHTATYPTAASRVSLKGIVDYLNNQFYSASNWFPVTAYEADGELVLQHNINREDCTLKISSPSNPAISALGFSSIVDLTLKPVQNYRLQVDGYIYDELATALELRNLTQGSNSTTITIGSTSGLELYANSLVHIYNHSTASEGGTYRVVSVGATTLNLNAAVAAGTYSIIIYRDTFNTNLSGNPKTLDFYIDGTRNTSVSIRQQTTVTQISGLKIVEVSQDFQAASATLALTKSGTTYSLAITISGQTGVASTFPQGFLGYIKVYAPNNVAYVTMFVFDVSPPFPRTDAITFSASEKTDGLLLLGTTHTDASSVLEIPLDRRNVGLVGNSAIASEFISGTIERDIANLHLSGIIRGFDVIQIDGGSLSITVRGGAAYVDGHYVEKLRQSINVINVATSDGTYNLLLSKEGLLEIYLEGTAGYSVEDVLAGASHVLICQITVASSLVTDTVDARFFINDVDSRLQLTVDDRELGAGSFRTLEAAILYSRYAPNDTKPDITVLSDITIADDLTIDDDTRVIVFGDLTIAAALTLGTNVKMECFGSITCTDTISLSDNASLLMYGEAAFTTATTSIDLGDSSSLGIFNNAEFVQIQITGSNVKVYGINRFFTATFDGTSVGILVSSGVENVFFESLNFEIVASTFAIISVSNITNVVFSQCSFAQDTTLSALAITNIARAGILHTGTATAFNIVNCLFSNLGAGLNSTGTIDKLIVSDTVFDGFGYGISLNIVTNAQLIDLFFESIKIQAITIAGASQDINISRCIFNERFDVTATPRVLVASASAINDMIVANNIVYNLITTQALYQINGEGIVIGSNIIADCQTGSAFVFNLTALTGESIVNGNLVTGHTGAVISALNANVVGNFFETTNVSGITSYNFATSSTYSNISSNIIKGYTADTLALASVNFVNNDVTIGKVTVADTTGVQIKGNRFILQDTSVSNAVDITLSGTTTVYSLFVGNFVSASPTNAVISCSTGRLSISNNVFLGGAGVTVVEIGHGSLSANNRLLVDGNIVTATTAMTNAILARTSVVSVVNNITSGSFSSGEIEAIITATDIYFHGNYVNGTGVGGKVVRHLSSTPINTSIQNNKNATEAFVYSTVDAMESGSLAWTKTVTLPGTVQLTSPGATVYLVVPLTGLPIGSQLSSVSLFAETPNASGSLNIRLIRRNSTSIATVDIGSSSGVDNTAFIYQQMNIVAASTHYIRANEDYMLVITSSDAGNTVGQVVAFIVR